jgi:hypothetical protein
MKYRLLLDIEAVEFMAALPRREQLQGTSINPHILTFCMG